MYGNEVVTKLKFDLLILIYIFIIFAVKVSKVKVL